MKKAIFLYDFTCFMAKPWLDAGYECWCFDGQHKEGITKEGNLYKVGMWFFPNKIEEHISYIKTLVGEGVEFVFGFPECTDLAVSGAAHFKKKLEKDPECQNNAIKLARLVESLGDSYNCKWGFENPISVISTKWRKPNFKFHPWEYGGYLPENDVHPLYPENIPARDAYVKHTCIWCGNGFIEPIKKPVPEARDFIMQLGGKSKKTKNIRSATPRGFAQAVFIHNRSN